MLANFGPENTRLYFSHPRPEILQLIPLESRRILDVGCGTGALGKTVKARQDCYYAGIEPHLPSYTEANRILDYVYHSTSEEACFRGFEKTFDCIILADVLEHLENPLSILRSLFSYLKQDGTLIVSIPNISHPHIVHELASGLFRYLNAGILDRTHLRFFTYISAQQLLASAQLRVTSVISHPSIYDPQQYIFTCKKISQPLVNPQLTVLLLCNNERHIIFSCIDSLRRSPPKEKIILCLDNGSSDDTISWLRDQPDVLSIHSEANLGFPIGNNLLLPCITTPYFLLSNADIIYPSPAISDLLYSIRELSPNAIVGPSGTNTSGLQNCPPLRFTDYKSLDNAYLVRKKIKPLIYNRIHRLVFFCTMFPLKAFSDIGYLNEIFSPGNFEDDDYCLRAIQKGYNLYHIPNIYIHHYGGNVYKRNPAQYQALLRKNYTIFSKLWSEKTPQILAEYYSRKNLYEE